MSELGFLLNTHIVIWWSQDDPRLSKRHVTLLDSNAPVFVSAVSMFEIAVKSTLGKLEVAPDFHSRLVDTRALELKVTWRHARAVEALPLLHRDPFDRLLIAQAVSEGLTLVTADGDIRRYDVPVL